MSDATKLTREEAERSRAWVETSLLFQIIEAIAAGKVRRLSLDVEFFKTSVPAIKHVVGIDDFPPSEDEP